MRVPSILAALLCIAVTLNAGDPRPVALPRSTPEAQGIASSAIQRFVTDAEQQIDALHSVMIVRHGHVVAEGWWAPYAADEPHVLYSLSKSFTSTAIGFAVAEGRLGVDDLVLGFFPDDAPAQASVNLKAMKVRDLLTMTTGHHDEDIKDFNFGADSSLVKTFLSLPVAHKPGTFFVYNTPASYMLSAIVQKVTGQTVLEYLRPRLFEPLGIRDPQWDASKQGVSLGGFGLSVRTEDIARFGLLYLQKGQWQGRQLLPASWVEAASARQVSNGSATTSDWEQGYGYQFWRCRHGFFRGDGAFGQFCLILPQYDTVIAITSGTRDMGAVMNLVWDRIVPALGPSALPENAAALATLRTRLSSLALAPQTGDDRPAELSSLLGRRYTFVTNPAGLEALSLDAVDAAGNASFTIRVAGADYRVASGAGAWRKSTVGVAGQPRAVAASGAWTRPDTYTMKLTLYQTPFVYTWQLRFAGDQLLVDTEQNVAFSETRTSQFVGRAQHTPTESR